MKTVLHVLKSNQYSGAENVIITLMHAMDKYVPGQYNMVYVSPDGPIRAILQEEGVAFEPVAGLSRTEIKRCIRKYQPDIIHAHDFSASVACAAVRPTCRLVSHLHNNPPWIKDINARTMLYAVSTRAFDQILCVSQAVIDEFHFRKAMAKARVVGNPVDLEKVRRMAASGPPPTKSYDILFLGRLSPPKNPLRFLSLMHLLRKQIPSVTAAMIGDGELRGDCENAIRQLELAGTVTLLGFQRNPYTLLANAKLLCMPSRWEGFGLVAIEAMSLGVPVVAAPVGGLAGLVNETYGRLCSSDDDFLQEMRLLLSSPDLHKAKSENAKAAAETLCDLEAYAQHINDIYQGRGHFL